MVVIAALTVAVLLVAATALGLLTRAGRTRRMRGTDLDPALLGVGALGARATLLQLSSPVCSHCRPTARLLGSIVATRPGVEHLEVDVTRHPGLAERLHVLQTPTTFLLDAAGGIRGRIGGRPRPDQLVRELDLLLETS